MANKPNAFARVELLVTAACLTVSICLVSLTIAQPDRAANSPLHPRSVNDAAQLRSIHQAWIIFAKEFNGQYPRPGLIDRLPDPVLGEIPGRGPEDVEANTTANLHSALIIQNFYSAELLISPVERNPKVRALRGDEYNYERYDPSLDVYWDSDFKADLMTGSNVSYAHMPICGERAARHWRETTTGRFPLLGNRGPKDGKLDPGSFTCGPHGNWAGNIAFSHDDVSFLTATQPENLTYVADDDVQKPDNLFAMESGVEGADAIIAFTRAMSKEGKPELQFD